MFPGDVGSLCFAGLSIDEELVGVLKKNDFYAKKGPTSSILWDIGIFKLKPITEAEYDTYLAFGFKNLGKDFKRASMKYGRR